MLMGLLSSAEDPTPVGTVEDPSIDENGEGLFLTKDSIEWFRRHYLGPELTLGDPASPAVSPHFVDDLSGVAPAHVLTAEFDPLRDEGDAYAARLAESGVPVVHTPHPGLVHGFLGFATLSPDAAQAVDAMTARVRHALHA